MSAASCSIRTKEVNGWLAITLANAIIEVTIVPDKGADIFSFVDVSSGIDVLGKTPWGLRPPGSAPRAGSADAQFLHNYEGAWQELFPNIFTPCIYNGKQIPLHGEVATLPWTMRVEQSDDDKVRIALNVRCQQVPLTLTRRMSLSAHSPELVIHETVQNISESRTPFVWGHHPLLGAPFLEEGCRINTGRCTVHTIDPYEPSTATLAPGRRSIWPNAPRIDGSIADLRKVSGPSAGIHDHVYLTDFERGWIEVENPRLGLAFGLEWDPAVFPWLINWRPFGGSHLPPLEGIYGVAIEPRTTRLNLTAAVEGGDALWLAGGGELSTSLKAILRKR